MSNLPKWIFAYGSLMWNPGFSYREKTGARLMGYHRRLCIESRRYRGSDEHPGLVFGLCKGGSCAGVAFNVEDMTAHELDELRRRELNSSVYLEKHLPIRLATGTIISALCYVTNTANEKYRRIDDLEAIHLRITPAIGAFGSNIAYVTQAQRALLGFDLADNKLTRLCQLIDGEPG